VKDVAFVRREDAAIAARLQDELSKLKFVLFVSVRVEPQATRGVPDLPKLFIHVGIPAFLQADEMIRHTVSTAVENRLKEWEESGEYEDDGLVIGEFKLEIEAHPGVAGEAARTTASIAESCDAQEV
jgi:hypothetical protein